MTLADNRVAGDVFADSYGSATYTNSNAGNGRTINVSGISISGADAGDYSYNTTAVTSANITQAPLTITANNQTMVYGSAGNILTAGVTVMGLLGSSDSVTGETLKTNATKSRPAASAEWHLDDYGVGGDRQRPFQ